VNSRFAYCDTNYFLLSQVVERVAGKPWRVLAAERLFRAAGHDPHEVLDDTTRVVPGRAASYEPRPGGGFAIDASDWQQTATAGADDRRGPRRWDATSNPARRRRTPAARDADGREAHDRRADGLRHGLFLNRYRGLSRVEHSGTWVGYRAAFTRFPEARTTVAVLCNVGSADAVGRANRLADVVLAGRFHDTPDPARRRPRPSRCRLRPSRSIRRSTPARTSAPSSASCGASRPRGQARSAPPRVRRSGAPAARAEIFRAGPARLSFAPSAGIRQRFEVAMDDTHASGSSACRIRPFHQPSEEPRPCRVSTRRWNAVPFRRAPSARSSAPRLSRCSRQRVCATSAPAPRAPASLLIAGAAVLDGTGAPARHASVRVREGRIAEIGELEPLPGETVVDASGLTLAPGFIDTHSHASGGLADHPDALAAVSQGITTVIVGQDGESAPSLAKAFAELEERPEAGKALPWGKRAKALARMGKRAKALARIG
jgi:hypothetical protein